ncbi:alpha/beta hydrolase [Mucilaginibacter dorajii]|uniref:Alpha/beta hydrolase n=1 Tax=Mucilaginibacter dorajii TaxID=692994 RepID=A0ABP7Q9D2_9SPHI|nr:alpha/beta hydrolase [Mucilaginibacter dorajii]MCS3737073.1 acetyl esterase/lipase [Mucilaginibacter dorajii]
MEDIKKRRESFEQLGKIYPKDASIKIEPVSINGLSCYWFTPNNAIANNIIIYLHGGVFAVGSIRSHEALVSHITGKLKTKVLFVEYALAPEHPFPAAPKDVFNVYKALLTIYPGHAISLIGDSAGGGLIVSLVGDLLKRQMKLPQAVVMISPWISLSCDNPSHEENRTKDPILTREYVKNSAKDYIGDTPLAIASPENVQLNAFPPVLIVVGTNEILLDDSCNFYEQVKLLQQKAVLSIYENQNHVWPLANVHSEASQKVLAEMGEFLKEL